MSKGEWTRTEDVQAYQQFSLNSYRITRANASRLARQAMTHLAPDPNELADWARKLKQLQPNTGWGNPTVAALNQCIEVAEQLHRLRQSMAAQIEQMKALLDPDHGAQLRVSTKKISTQILQADFLVDSLIDAVRFHHKLHEAGLNEADLSDLLRQPYSGPQLIDPSPRP